MDDDLDDTHLCIKCNRTIVGLENYIQHRKTHCSIPATCSDAQPTKITTSTTTSVQQVHTDVTPAITYEPFHFNESEPPNTASHGGKTSKTLGDSYELHYELEADIFFSSLQLQSVQSQHLPSTTGGKTGNLPHTGPITRQKSVQLEAETNSPAAVNWINSETTQQKSGEHFLKDAIFKNITYEHESPEVTDEEEEEDDLDVEIDDDDEDYDPLAEAHGSGGKWKLSLLRHSPPVVPISHTGGKWKPEHRPDLRVTHSQLSRASPTWDDHLEEADGHENQHPPAEHTKGKWIPGTKLQRLEYKEVVELAKCSKTDQDYWCNICCRKLKSKLIYENHLKTSYHQKRSEPELQLEKAAIQELPRVDVKKNLSVVEFRPLTITVTSNRKKRKRRCIYVKCSLCKHVMTRHLIGKHLISHYHYRRMQVYPGVSLSIILENIHAIVLQSPFQCRPCRFYANTEEMFLLHWNSASHLDASEGPGRFWCSYCQFECEDNNQMRRHLLGPEHKEVLLATNRSVPICISRRLSIDCTKCGQTFRFNFELRRHITNFHHGMEFTGTASDTYQSKFKCYSCPEVLPSKIALQRHEKFKHSVYKYFCSICNFEFATPCQARRHRKTLQHKQKATYPSQKAHMEKEINEIFKMEMEIDVATKDKSKQDDQPSTSEQAKLQIVQQNCTPATVTYKCTDCSFTTPSQEHFKLHGQREHVGSQHNCILCSTNFASAQELGRHSRICKPKIIIKPEEVQLDTQLQEILTEQGEKIWLCDLCNFKSPFRSEVLYHRVFHAYVSQGKSQLLPCPLCDKKFRKQSLRFHLHNHTNEKYFKCEICGSTFSRPYNLKDHIKNVHGERNKNQSSDGKTIVDANVSNKPDKLFPCDSCDKVFKSKYSMKVHHMAHHLSTSDAGSHVFKCFHKNCEYTAVTKSLFNIHLNSHSLESFKCTTRHCNYVGKSKLHLRRHLQSHKLITETKHFSCKECSFKTKIKSHLIRHMRRHTGEKPYPCPYCNFRCRTWENLRKHILKTDKHVGKFVFECQNCNEEVEKNKEQKKDKIINGFKTNSYKEYQHHLKKQHNIENNGTPPL